MAGPVVQALFMEIQPVALSVDPSLSAVVVAEVDGAGPLGTLTGKDEVHCNSLPLSPCCVGKKRPPASAEAESWEWLSPYSKGSSPRAHLPWMLDEGEARASASLCAFLQHPAASLPHRYLQLEPSSRSPQSMEGAGGIYVCHAWLLSQSGSRASSLSRTDLATSPPGFCTRAGVSRQRSPSARTDRKMQSSVAPAPA